MSDKLQQIIQRQGEQQNSPDADQLDDVVQLVGFIVGDEENPTRHHTLAIYPENQWRGDHSQLCFDLRCCINATEWCSTEVDNLFGPECKLPCEL